MNLHLVIGAGGTASWLIPLLKKTLPKEAEITVCDGDILSESNLNRQLFDYSFIGWNKAEALAYLYDIGYSPLYYTRDWIGDPRPYSAIWCCADNHAARALVLEQVDLGIGQLAIIAGNEYTDSEAYAYLPSWKGTAADPRVYYPELLTDQGDNPADPDCQQRQNITRQLALANYLSAGFLVHLYWFLTNHGSQVKLTYWPTRHFSNFSSFFTKRYDL